MLVSRSFTKRDLKSYYFYYEVGRRGEQGRTRETEIFEHLVDGLALERVTHTLRRKLKSLRFGGEEEILHAALHRFFPRAHKVGRVLMTWNREKLNELFPKKRPSGVRWYYVWGTMYVGKGRASKERDFRSKSFRATSIEEAEKKGRAWLARFSKRLKPRGRIYTAQIDYANRARGWFCLPNSKTNAFVEP